MTFQWQRPRTIGLDGATLAQVRAYEAHSLPGEPYDIEPSADLGARVYALTHLVPILPPCEAEDDEDSACIECENGGEINVAGWRIPFCPECGREPNDKWAELFDDMEHRGK